MTTSAQRTTPGHAPAATTATVSDAEGLESRLATMKQEIDALQIGAAEAARPWYRHASVVIAVVALIFSFGTTFYANKRTQQQDEHNAKVELRQLIQRLSQLPERNLDLDTKYAKRPDLQAAVSGLLNTENIVLTKQALDVMEEIPDQVSSMEYFAVASAVSLSGDFRRAREVFQSSLEAAEDANDWTTASRGLGATEFAVGELSRGRAAFKRGLEVPARFPARNDYVRDTDDAFTEIRWGQAELGAGQCAEGRKHLASADATLSGLPRDSFTLRYAGDLDAVRRSAPAACR